MRYKWLTEENVELLETMLRQMGMICEGDAKRLIADWRKMRQLLIAAQNVLAIGSEPKQATILARITSALWRTRCGL